MFFLIYRLKEDYQLKNQKFFNVKTGKAEKMGYLGDGPSVFKGI
jgi:hypothetical protein